MSAPLDIAQMHALDRVRPVIEHAYEAGYLRAAVDAGLSYGDLMARQGWDTDSARLIREAALAVLGSEDAPVEAEPAPLVVQQGHRYLRRDGVVVDQTEPRHPLLSWPWDGSDNRNRNDDGSYDTPARPHPLDFVADLGPIPEGEA